MNPTQTGRQAEQVAADFLAYKNCSIADRNWRTRWCEIDIVAIRGDTVYFCEVKYRRRNLQGAGAEYVTAQKRKQMLFAAEFWIATHSWSGSYELCVIEVSGADFRITGIFKNVM